MNKKKRSALGSNMKSRFLPPAPSVLNRFDSTFVIIHVPEGSGAGGPRAQVPGDPGLRCRGAHDPEIIDSFYQTDVGSIFRVIVRRRIRPLRE